MSRCGDRGHRLPALSGHCVGSPTPSGIGSKHPNELNKAPNFDLPPPRAAGRGTLSRCSHNRMHRYGGSSRATNRSLSARLVRPTNLGRGAGRQWSNRKANSRVGTTRSMRSSVRRRTLMRRSGDTSTLRSSFPCSTPVGSSSRRLVHSTILSRAPIQCRT
jgi:hypothetical protein